MTISSSGTKKTKGHRRQALLGDPSSHPLQGSSQPQSLLWLRKPCNSHLRSAGPGPQQPGLCKAGKRWHREGVHGRGVLYAEERVVDPAARQPGFSSHLGPGCSSAVESHWLPRARTPSVALGVALYICPSLRPSPAQGHRCSLWTERFPQDTATWGMMPVLIFC